MSFFSAIRLDRAIPVKCFRHPDIAPVSTRTALLIWFTASLLLWAILTVVAVGIGKLAG